jgi:hypothetical protein
MRSFALITHVGILDCQFKSFEIDGLLSQQDQSRVSIPSIEEIGTGNTNSNISYEHQRQRCELLIYGYRFAEGVKAMNAIKGEGCLSIKQRNRFNAEKTASSDKTSDSEWLIMTRSAESIGLIVPRGIETWHVVEPRIV